MVYQSPCNFGETDDVKGTFCGLTQPDGAKVLWQLKNGRTLTPNTGPSSGQGGTGTQCGSDNKTIAYSTRFSGWYAHVISDGNKGNAELITPWLTYNETKNCMMYIAWNLNGVDVDNITFTFERLFVTPVGYQIKTVRTFTRRNNRGDVWIRTTFTVRTILGGQKYVPFRVRIGGGVNGKPYGDLAIDTITFGACPGSGQICNL